MAGTAIQNIKILHKRYSTTQWTNGIQVNGQQIIPTLAQGEIGLDTTTFEVRIGTDSSREQKWSEARVIDASTGQSFTYYHKDGSSSTAANSDENYVATDVSIGVDKDGKHNLTVIYKSIDLIAPEQELTVTDGTATVGEGEVAVVTAVSGTKAADGSHTITTTKSTAATKAYVDTKFSTVRNITVQDGGTLEDDGAGTITYVSKVEESTADHTIKVTKQKLVLPEIEVAGNDAAGDYIASVAVDTTDDHKIVVTKGTLPTLSTGTGSGNGNGATLVGGISVNGHEVTASKKSIVGSGDAVKITGTTDTITISVDAYTKAQVDEMHEELGKAMEFMGTLASDGTGTATSLPTASKDTIGHVYKVAVAGSYGGKDCKVGDVFICDTNQVWRYIPSGDDIEDTWRPISVNGTAISDTKEIDIVEGSGIDISSANGTITIAHEDTSTVEDASRIKLEVIDSVSFDDYGHVKSYLKKKFVAGDNVQLTEDGSGNITISATDTADTNTAHTHSVGQGLEVTGDGGIDGTVTYSHKDITTTQTTNTSKTVTAGATSGNTLNVVESVVADGMGHITEVKTTPVTFNIEVPEDTNTTYEIGATAKSTLAGETAANINLTAGGSGSGVDSVAFKVDAATTAPADGLSVKVENDTITLSGKATADLLGLIRAAYSLNSENSSVATDATLKNFSGNHNDRLYGVNVRTDGTAFVEVPWTDTTYTASGMITMEGTTIKHVSSSAPNQAVDMYAFGTDAYGHISSVAAITTIDGNYA